MTPLKIGGVPEHFNLPWHLAIESKKFESAGLKVEYIDFPGGTGAMTRGLVDSKIDVALVLSEGAVAFALKGNPVKLVKVYVQSPLIWGIHVSAKSSYHSIDDIKGKKYAVSRMGSGSHLMAIVDAAERGWSTDLEFVKVGGLEGAREALPDGEADAFLWEKFMTQPLVDNGEFRRVGERCVPWPAFVVAVRDDVLADRKEELKATFDIIDQECQALMNNKDAIQLISERYQLSPAETETWFSHVKWHEGFDEPVQELNKIIGYLEKVDIVETKEAKPSDVWVSLED